MKIFSKLFSKKEKLKSPHISNIRCNYVCEDANLEYSIKSYLNETRTAKDCLQDFIEQMAYTDCLHMKENETIFPLLEDFLENATWKRKWTADCGDYDPQRPEPWLRCIYSVYDNIIMEIEGIERMLGHQNRKITTEAVMKYVENKAITPQVYEHKDQFVSKKEEIKAIIEKETLTPKDALLLIRANWDFLYPHSSSYEAIEYCVAASENHAEPIYFKSAFRDFGYTMGTLYRKAKEK